MRLSSYTGDYVSRAAIIERKAFTASPGDIEFSLLSVEGVEEVYVDGLRKLPEIDYVYLDNKVTMLQALTGGESVLLVGRSDQQDFRLFNSASERQVLSDGQMTITLSAITTDGIEVYISSINDSRKLVAGIDYTVESDEAIRLTSSFASGTVLEVYQGVRPAWPNPNEFMIYDGKSTMSLSARLAATMIDADYENGQGRYYQTIAVGSYLQRYLNKVPSTSGTFTSILYNGVFWDPETNYDIPGTVTAITDSYPLEVSVRGTDNIVRPYYFYKRPSLVRNISSGNTTIRDGVTELSVSNGSSVTIAMAARDSFTLILDNQGGTVTLPASWNIAGSFTPGPLVIYRGIRYGNTWLVEGVNF